MARRLNDPQGVSESPAYIVIDPVRVTKIKEEVGRRVLHLKRRGLLEKQLRLGKQSYNGSLAQLKAARSSPPTPGVSMSRLDPRLELAINMRARELAGLVAHEPLRPEHGRFVAEAVQHVAKTAEGLRGLSAHEWLVPYVAGLMAIWQEATGTPVMGPRDKNSVYDPHARGLAGAAIRMIIDQLEPGISDSKLSYWIREVRKKYAGKPMRFRDLFPDYGMQVAASTGEPKLRAPYRVEQFGITNPIYCPSQN